MVTDILHISTVDEAYGAPIFNITIHSDNVLLTGGGFGTEASIIAIIGYLSICGFIFTIESKLHSGNGYMHEWHIYKKFGGGMIYDWGVHLIDQILFMMPDAKVISLYADIKNGIL